MVKGLFLRSAALAAMIAAGTLAVPAQAQEDVDRSEMREQRMERRAERQEVQQRPEQAAQEQQAPQQPRHEFRQQRQERQAQAAPEWQAQRDARQQWRQQRQAERAQQAAPQPQVERGDSDGDRDLQGYTEGTQRDRAWARRQSAVGPAPTENAANGQIQHRDWRGRDGSNASDRGERNRSYADRDRNGSYRDGNRGSGHDWRSNHDNRDHNGYNNSWRDGHNADGYRDRRHRDAYRSGYRNGHRDDWRSGNHRRWNNDWRRDNRYNWSGYRNQHRNVFSVGRYYSPYRNYSYSRLSIGFFLDRGFYGNNYWVNDPWQYRLPEVYGPYKWVRYYDDVILVDIYSGEVVDVIHNFFW